MQINEAGPDLEVNETDTVGGQPRGRNFLEQAIEGLAHLHKPPGVELTRADFIKLTNGGRACRAFINGECTTRNPCSFLHLDRDALIAATDISTQANPS